MALVNEEIVVDGKVASTDKSISLEAPANNILYTVPEGRKFEGVLNSSYSGHTSAFYINYKGIYLSGGNTPAFPVKLLEGDVVRAWSYAGSIFGIESDA